MNWIILAHGDCDGVCSASLAVAARKDAKIVFTNPANLLSELKRIAEGNVVILDIALTPRHRDEIVSSMAVPLQARGQTLGVLCVNSMRRSRLFSEEDLKLAFALATYAAIAIDNARLSAVSSYEHFEKMLTTVVSQNEQRLVGRRGHSGRVSALCKQLLIEMGYDPAYAQRFAMAVLGHEVGMIALPDSILNKQGKLTRSERQLLEQFPLYSEQFIKLIPQLSEFSSAIRHHMERIDGSGYPDRLVGQQIPRLAMVIAVCDVYDALVCLRPHRPPLSPDEAVAELKQMAGRQLDAEIVSMFISMLEKQSVIAKQSSATELKS